MELRNTYTSRLRGKEKYDNVEPFSTTHFELALFKNVKPSIYTDKTKAQSPRTNNRCCSNRTKEVSPHL
jgi:hypothetical protein